MPDTYVLTSHSINESTAVFILQIRKTKNMLLLILASQSIAPNSVIFAVVGEYYKMLPLLFVGSV